MAYNLILKDSVFSKIMELKKNTHDSVLCQALKNISIIQQAIADQIKLDPE